jgi:hypothetical protein
MEGVTNKTVCIFTSTFLVVGFLLFWTVFFLEAVSVVSTIIYHHRSACADKPKWHLLSVVNIIEKWWPKCREVNNV